MASTLITVAGIPVHACLCSDAHQSRLSALFVRAYIPLKSHCSEIRVSVTASLHSMSFTSIVEFVIDPRLQHCDVIMGLDWSYQCQSAGMLPLTMGLALFSGAPCSMLPSISEYMSLVSASVPVSDTNEITNEITIDDNDIAREIYNGNLECVTNAMNCENFPMCVLDDEQPRLGNVIDDADMDHEFCASGTSAQGTDDNDSKIDKGIWKGVFADPMSCDQLSGYVLDVEQSHSENVMSDTEMDDSEVDRDVPGTRTDKNDSNITTEYVKIWGKLGQGRCDDGDYCLLGTRELRNLDGANGEWEDAPLSVPGEVVKDELNMRGVVEFAARSGQNFVWYYSADICAGEIVSEPLQRGVEQSHMNESAQASEAQASDGRIPLVIGMPVMICSNLDIEGGIVRGCIAKLENIRYWVDTVGRRHAISCEVRMSSTARPRHIVAMRFGCPSQHNIYGIRRLQIPVVPAFALTAHKTQGRTHGRSRFQQQR